METHMFGGTLTHTHRLSSYLPTNTG